MAIAPTTLSSIFSSPRSEKRQIQIEEMCRQMYEANKWIVDKLITISTKKSPQKDSAILSTENSLQSISELKEMLEEYSKHISKIVLTKDHFIAQSSRLKRATLARLARQTMAPTGPRLSLWRPSCSGPKREQTNIRSRLHISLISSSYKQKRSTNWNFRCENWPTSQAIWKVWSARYKFQSLSRF